MTRSDSVIRSAATLAALSAAACALFLPSLGAPVYLDDGPYVFGSAYLRSPAPFFWSALFSPSYLLISAERSWQPFVSVVNRLFVDAPFFLRLLSVLLHAFCAFLVARLSQSYSSSRKAAFFAAALFLSFPPSAETVFFASAKGHILACIAVLASLLAWREKNVVLSVVALAAGLCCKETVLVALPLLFLDDVLTAKNSSVAVIRSMLPHIIVAAVFVLFRFAVLTPPPTLMVPADPRPFAALAWSLSAFVLPPAPGFFRTLPSGGAWIALTLGVYAAALWHRRGDKDALFFLLWPLAALLPFLHLIPFAAKSPVADRYLYIAAAGVALALARFAESRGRAALAALVLLWSWGTLKRAALYRDPLALSEAGIAAAPTSAAARLFSAESRFKAGDAAGASDSAAEAARLEPRDAQNWAWLGITAHAAKREERAESAFKNALDLQETPEARANLGAFYEETGRTKEALAEYDRAAALAPGWEKPRALAAALRAPKR